MPSPPVVAPTQGMTDKQIAFAEHYLGLAGRNQQQAAIMAGYARSGADAHASRLLRDPRILNYLRWLVETKIKAQVVASLATLEWLRDDPMTPAATRKACASELLDRAGMLVEKINTMVVVHEQRRSNANDLRELVDAVISLDIGVAVIDEAKLARALALAQQRDQGSPIIDVTPTEGIAAGPAPIDSMQNRLVIDARADERSAVDPAMPGELTDDALAAVL